MWWKKKKEVDYNEKARNLFQHAILFSEGILHVYQSIPLFDLIVTKEKESIWNTLIPVASVCVGLDMIEQSPKKHKIIEAILKYLQEWNRNSYPYFVNNRAFIETFSSMDKDISYIEILGHWLFFCLNWQNKIDDDINVELRNAPYYVQFASNNSNEKELHLMTTVAEIIFDEFADYWLKEEK
jgi:hypothetical protein